MPAVDSYVYAHASIGLLVHYHGLLVANLWKATAGRRQHYRKTDRHNESCYRADAGHTNRGKANGAEFSK